jgi:predicted nucleic acid-binding protein
LTLIIDASVVLKWYLADEPHGENARAILSTGDALLAPDLVVPEVCNAAWLGVRAARLTQSQAEEIARSVPRFFSALISSAALAERAVMIAGELDHPVYDCFYLALADARGVLFITADVRLLRKVRNTRWITATRSLVDYPPEA